MRCFRGSANQTPTQANESADNSAHPPRYGSPASSSTATSPNAITTTTTTTTTINLRREYTLAVQTNSYNEIWSKIHPPEEPGSASSSAHLISGVLQPDRASIEETLRSARPTHLTRLVSLYLDSSESTSHFFLSLHRSVDQARSLYRPISDLLDILPSDHPLSQPQFDWALDKLHQFGQSDNPFPTPDFAALRQCFADLKLHLDARLLRARRRHRLLRRATRGSAACLVVSAAAAAVSGLVVAAHALVTLAGPAAACAVGDPLAGRRRRLREEMRRVDAAAREAYVLDNNLDTIERLVARLHAAVESDKVLVRLGLESGRGQRHPVQEVVRHLRKTHSSFQHQLRDLDEHICLCFATVNRARSQLLQQIHH